MLELVFKMLTVMFSPETEKLSKVVHQFAPREVSEHTAWEHTVAARMAETPQIPATLLLSMAYSESRYNPYSVSHVRDGKRRWGIFKTDKPPTGVSGPYFCGVTQVRAHHSWKRCMQFRNIFYSYTTAVNELNEWLKMPPCRSADDRMLCALLGYGGGFPAIEANSSTYPSRVLGRARAFARKTAPST